MLFVSFSVGLSVLTGCVVFGRIDEDADEDIAAEAGEADVMLPAPGAGTDDAATLLLWLAPADEAAFSFFSGVPADEPDVPEIGWLAGAVLSSNFGR